MPEAHLDLFRQGVEDVQRFWELLDEHVVWDARGRRLLDQDEICFGRDAVIGASRRYWGAWTDYRLDAEELIDAGTSVVVMVRERGRGKGSGAPIDHRWAQVWTFSRGRIVRWELYPDRAAALEAVGLAE